MKFLSIFTLDPSTMTGPPSEEMKTRMDALIRELIGGSCQLFEVAGIPAEIRA